MKSALLILSLFVGLVTFGQENNIKLDKQGDLYKVTLLHDNGNIAQTGYLNIEKELHGMWTSYNTNGEKLAIGNYMNGKKAGSWLFFNNNSDLLTQVTYGEDHKIASVQKSMSRSQLADSDLEE